MALSAYALTTLAKAKQFLGRSDYQHRESGVDVYCSAGDATTATAQVTDTTLVLTIVGGLSAAVTTLTFTDADSDTLAEIITKINAAAGWTANLAGYGAENSTNLTVMPSTSCLTESESLTLMYVPDELITELINRATFIIEQVCGRKMMSRSYAEWYSGDGGNEIILKNYPVTAVARVAIGEVSAMSIRNTSTDAMYATASVSTTGITLVIVGGANAGTDTVTFAAAATVATMVTAIVALGKGWESSAASSLYNGYPSSELFVRGAQSCLSSWSYHYMPSDPVNGYKIDLVEGVVGLPSTLSVGWPNVYIQYTAGYATIPDDIENACLETVAYLYGLAGEDPSLAEVESDNWKFKRQAYADGLPKSIQQTLYRYKAWSNGT